MCLKALSIHGLGNYPNYYFPKKEKHLWYEDIHYNITYNSEKS